MTNWYRMSVVLTVISGWFLLVSWPLAIHAAPPAGQQYVVASSPALQTQAAGCSSLH